MKAKERLTKFILNQAKKIKKKNIEDEEPKEEINFKNTLLELDNDQQEEIRKEEKKKLKIYFRSRYATFLKTLKEKNYNQKLKEENVEIKMKKLKDTLKKQLGVNDIQSKIFTREKELNKENNKNNSNVDDIRTHIRRTIDKPEENKRSRAISNCTVVRNIKLNVEEK